MQISGLALSDVQDVLSDVLDERVRGIEVHPLEESLRERPWRLELELARTHVKFYSGVERDAAGMRPSRCASCRLRRSLRLSFCFGMNQAID